MSPRCYDTLTVLFRSGLPSLPGAHRRSHCRNRLMPRKEKAAVGAEPSGPVAQDGSGAVIITVRVKPASKLSSVTEVSADAVGVSVAAPPADGEANTELLRYLAKVLELKKSHLSLDKGSRSRNKLIRVSSCVSPEEVLRRLRLAAG